VKAELQQGMGTQIVEKLRGFGDLPDEGIVAGQAVSSAIFDLFSPDSEGMVVYNDVDIFRVADAKDIDIAEEKLRTLDTVKYHNFLVKNEYLSLKLYPESHYKIVNSHRQGLINTIAFTDLVTYSNISTSRAIIQGFDLNITQVGVDLATKELTWTPEFERFFYTRQLEISNLQTPNHTAMRWFKKREELPGVFGDDDFAMEMVSAISSSRMQNSTRKFDEKEHLRWRFGEKNSVLYHRFASKMQPYFDLVKESNEIYFLECTQETEKSLVDMAKKYHSKYFAWAFNQSRRSRKTAKKKLFNHIIQPGMLGGGSGGIPLPLASLIQQGDKYLAGNVSPVQVQRINTMAKGYRSIFRLMFHLSVTEQLSEIENWLALERQYGRWIFGFVDVHGFINSGMYYEAYAEYWVDKIEHYYAVVNNPFDKLVDHPRFEVELDGYHCRELIVPRDLFDEGNELHHCVGGYANAVREGLSRIISVRHTDKKRWSTIEICNGADDEWVIKQHLSFQDAEPSPQNVALEKDLLAKVNEHYIEYLLSEVGSGGRPIKSMKVNFVKNQARKSPALTKTTSILLWLIRYVGKLRSRLILRGYNT